jgi:hypothetical protein
MYFSRAENPDNSFPVVRTAALIKAFCLVIPSILKKNDSISNKTVSDCHSGFFSCEKTGKYEKNSIKNKGKKRFFKYTPDDWDKISLLRLKP